MPGQFLCLIERVFAILARLEAHSNLGNEVMGLVRIFCTVSRGTLFKHCYHCGTGRSSLMHEFFSQFSLLLSGRLAGVSDMDQPWVVTWAATFEARMVTRSPSGNFRMEMFCRKD